MESYQIALGQNSGLQVGHNGGTINYSSSAPRRKADTAFDVPDLLSQYFTGRKNEIAQLKEIYQTSHQTSHPNVPARCIIYGMPGLGKTQLALRFANSSKDDYPFIFWISGASTEKLNSGFTRIFDHVGGEARDEDGKNRAAKRWLEHQEKRWLLIVDNVNEQTLPNLRDMLPARNARGNVLITTRFQNVAESLEFAHGERHNSIDLQYFEEHDAVDLFLAIRHKYKSDNSGEHEDIKVITKKVGYLPLAIDQAASLSNAPGLNTRRVLDMYTAPRSNEAFEWESETTKHESRSVITCFKPILDQLNQSSPEACTLLRIFAFLDPECIPMDVIKYGIEHFQSRSRMRRLKERIWKKTTKFKLQGTSHTTEDEYLEDEDEEDMQHLCSVFKSTIKLPRLIQTLKDFSIVKVKGDDNSIFWIHDLVHQLIRQNLMNDDQQGRWLKIAINVTKESFNQIKSPAKVKNWNETTKYVAHVQKLREYLTIQKKDDNSLASMELWVAIYLNEYGSYTEAAKILERSLVNSPIAPDGTNSTILRRKLTLANAYWYQGKLKDSEDIYVELIAARKRVLGAEHPNTLGSVNNLAVTYYQQGRLKEAEDLGVEVLAARKRVLGAEHPDTLGSMSGLATTYHEQGRLKEAEDLGVEVVAAQKRVLSAEHPDTLRSMSGLASTYRQQGRLKEAEDLRAEVLAARKRVLGAEHPDTLGSIGGLAVTYYQQGRLKEAEDLGVEVLAARKRVLGAEHPDTLWSMHNLALTLKDIGNIEEAISLMETVANQRSKVLGIDHPSTKDSIEALARWRNSRDPDSTGDNDNVENVEI